MSAMRRLMYLAPFCLLAVVVRGQNKDCEFTDSGLVPLPDLVGEYLGQPGGLYPGGGNTPPAAHLARGLEIAMNEIQPLDAEGRPDPQNGKIVMISVGMANTTQEFAEFAALASADPASNPRLFVVDGAQNGQDAPDWISPSAGAWKTVDKRLTQKKINPAQVQVAWIKQVIERPGREDVIDYAEYLKDALADTARSLKVRYPNVKIAYLSSRTRAYRDDRSVSPEPYAYASGFSVRWVIADQISGAEGLASDVAPWLAWGPYLWSDGPRPRSDGFTWHCEDTGDDGTRPSESGRKKVADQLLAFFKTDPTAAPWFLKPAGPDGPRITSVTASPASGPAPLTVELHASLAEPLPPDLRHVWTFGDGTFSYNEDGAPAYNDRESPVKTFFVPGTYPVRLTVIDAQGNSAQGMVEVTVRPMGTSPFLRGDANEDGKVDISDPTAILNHLFLGQASTCRDAADANDSGEVDITDPINLLKFLFQAGLPPSLPFPAVGPDPTEDSLGCE